MEDSEEEEDETTAAEEEDDEEEQFISGAEDDDADDGALSENDDYGSLHFHRLCLLSFLSSRIAAFRAYLFSLPFF